MKTLLFLPLLCVIQPVSARPCDSTESTVTANTTATPARSPAPAETDVPAKKNATAPTAPRTPAPKQHRSVRPGYLFM